METLPLYDGCVVYFQRGWLDDADRLFEDIKRQVPFGEYQAKMGAKVYNVPRGIFAFGDPGICTNDADGNLVEGTGHVYGRPKKKYLSFAWDVTPSVLQDSINIAEGCEMPLGFHFASPDPPEKKMFQSVKELEKLCDI